MCSGGTPLNYSHEWDTRASGVLGFAKCPIWGCVSCVGCCVMLVGGHSMGVGSGVLCFGVCVLGIGCCVLDIGCCSMSVGSDVLCFGACVLCFGVRVLDVGSCVLGIGVRVFGFGGYGMGAEING